LSTNGLALPDHVDEIQDMNIDHVTLTINMVDPQVGTAIYPWVFYKHKRWTGLDAAKILHERQMQSLEMLSERKILVKVNSVMIPGINDDHLVEVNKVVKQKGAFPVHGTHYGLTGQRGPRAMELKALQDKLSDGTKLMRHCRQCRADAVGLLGEDRGQEFTMEHVPEGVSYNPDKRDAYREVVARERGEHIEAKKQVQAEINQDKGFASFLVAIATKGGGRINQHFGHAKEFQVYEVTAQGIQFIGHRKVDQYCQGGWGEEVTLDGVIQSLEGVSVVLCSKIGDCPKESLAKAGIEVTDTFAHEWIEAGILAYRQTLRGSEQAAPRSPEQLAQISA
jgi:nitrogen fixation protein NifB